MELNPKGLLMQRLDAGLQAKAEELMAPRDKEGQGLFCKGGNYPYTINPDCGSFVAK
jgi:hypothetical protein